MIYYENIIFYRDSSHNAVLFIIDSLTLFRDKKIHINNANANQKGKAKPK